MSCITEILKLKGDREVFIPLNKDEEPWIAVEGGGIYKDYEYLIVLNHHAHRCGYVAIPPEHKANKVGSKENPYYDGLIELDYNKLDIDCHGGLTFGGNNHDLKLLLKNVCADNWIGFDCGHAFDGCDVEAFTKYFGKEKTKDKEVFFNMCSGAIKDFDYVEKECKSIIDQLINFN